MAQVQMIGAHMAIAPGNLASYSKFLWQGEAIGMARPAAIDDDDGRIKDLTKLFAEAQEVLA
jgi:hypothetical protein